MLTLTVRKIEQEAENIRTYELVGAHGGELPAFTAGAHIQLHLTPQMIRCYSLCGDPEERGCYRIAVLRTESGRGGSVFMHDAVTVGARIQAGAVRNGFALEEASRPHVLIAGGIGITPILSMAYSLCRSGTSYQLIYCARSRAHMAFRELLRSAPLRDHTTLHATSEQGRPDVASLLAQAPADAIIYVCGPQSLINSAVDAARGRWPIRYECFIENGMLEGGAAFDCWLQRSQRLVHVSERQSMLDALVYSGVTVPSQCGLGICGSCLTTYLDGVIDHRDEFLTEEQRRTQVMPCVSRAHSRRIVLDL